MGYVQGMCDLLAPLMVILDDGETFTPRPFTSNVLHLCVLVCVCVSECLAYSCFTQLMKRMSQNFPNGGAMDTHFANMRSLIQVINVCVCVLFALF